MIITRSVLCVTTRHSAICTTDTCTHHDASTATTTHEPKRRNLVLVKALHVLEVERLQHPAQVRCINGVVGGQCMGFHCWVHCQLQRLEERGRRSVINTTAEALVTALKELRWWWWWWLGAVLAMPNAACGGGWV